MKHLTTETRRHGGLRKLGSFEKALTIVRAALREIFDESAYERYLARTDAERSVSSYRAFIRERENAMARKQRCC